MNYKREVIGENIGFSTIIDEKFNTCSVYIRFITELTEEHAAENAIACAMPAISNSKLKTMGEMFDTVSELYGSNIGSSAGERGDAQILGIYASWICSRFAFDNEDIDGRMLEIIHDSIFCPNAQNGSFDDASFRIAQKNIIDEIKGLFNDKRSYAFTQAQKLAFRGEPAGCPYLGTAEQAENATAESAFRTYRNLLETAQIEIFYITPEENTAVKNMFRDGFSEISRHSHKYTIYSKSPLKSEPESISEEFDIRQSKIVFMLKSESDDRFACDMLATVLGKTPVSKFFANVREKLSLCYYCACDFDGAKNTVAIDCGVEKANIDKARDEIFRQIDEVKNGNISDYEIRSALLAIENAYSGIGDTPAQYASWYFSGLCRGEILTPQEYIQKFREVTKERIIEAAKSFSLDSSYYMLNREADK